MRYQFSRALIVSFTLLTSTLTFALTDQARAATLQLAWTDNSNNETGFKIERKAGTGGTFAVLANVTSNVNTYSDASLADSTTYCYRVNAFNDAGASSYTSEACATTQAPPAITYSVTLAAPLGGTVTSSPAGINCGSACVTNFTSGVTVTLQAVAASGYSFSGWSGNSDCVDGSLTINANKSCAASFTANPTNYLLTVNTVGVTSASGTGSGKILSSPAAIDCGSTCTATFQSGAAVTLQAIPATGSTFTGWSGNSDCLDGSLTINASKSCSASFSINSVTLSVTKNGKGKVTSSPSGIDCGSACSASIAAGTVVSLHATADPGFVFSGWSSGCSGSADCAMTVSSNTTATANFSANLTDKIGLYRPSTGEWFLDRNASGAWEGCNIDLCVQLFTGSDALPVVGDWNNSGVTKLGLFAADTTEWFLDANGNGIWDGCQIDICSQAFGLATDLPVIGQWSAGTEDRIAIFRSSENKWHLDINGNETLNTCKIDKCAGFSVYQSGDVPVAGDWTGRGTTQLGLFRPSTGQWFLDRNANRTWNGCNKDRCISSFGQPGDVPITGDWNGTGISKIGLFRPATSEWLLDLNGNDVWDGCNVDKCVTAFGQAGDLPVAGKW